MAKMFPSSPGLLDECAPLNLDASAAELPKLADALGELESRRCQLEEEIAALDCVPASKSLPDLDGEVRKREDELTRVETSMQASFDDWKRRVDGWIDLYIAQSLANYVLAELKAEKVGAKFKYACLHAGDHRQVGQIGIAPKCVTVGLRIRGCFVLCDDIGCPRRSQAEKLPQEQGLYKLMIV
jgi:hypothetical protein